MKRCISLFLRLVMIGLDPAIHIFSAAKTKDVDAPIKPGHGEPISYNP